MAYRAPLLLDHNKIVSLHRGLRVLPIALVLNGPSHNCNLAEGGKDFDNFKLLSWISVLPVELRVYDGG